VVESHLRAIADRRGMKQTMLAGMALFVALWLTCNDPRLIPIRFMQEFARRRWQFR
jgi:hypothetical protein